jgi:hypothetical protein
MAKDPKIKIGVGDRRLQPYFIGTTDGKNAKNVAVKHTHYVLIETWKAAKLGISKKAILREGLDSTVDGVVFRNTNRKTTQTNKKGKAKRHIERGGRAIEMYLNNRVKSKDGLKESWETYTVGFPSGVPLRVILKFIRDNCSKVVRINTGSNFYGVR